jgi:hypothetical protein
MPIEMQLAAKWLRSMILVTQENPGSKPAQTSSSGDPMSKILNTQRVSQGVGLAELLKWWSALSSNSSTTKKIQPAGGSLNSRATVGPIQREHF